MRHQEKKRVNGSKCKTLEVGNINGQGRKRIKKTLEQPPRSPENKMSTQPVLPFIRKYEWIVLHNLLKLAAFITKCFATHVTVAIKLHFIDKKQTPSLNKTGKGAAA